MDARAAAREAFAEQQGQHQQQGHQGNLGRTRQVGALQPRRIDADGQGLHPKVLGGTQIIEALHQGERDARGQGRSRQRQRHALERPERCLSQGAGNLEHAHGLLREAGPGRQVNVRVKHTREHQHASAQRTNLGEPVIPRTLPAEQSAQQLLHGSRIVKQFYIAIGDDVGRHRQRQHQQSVEKATPREPIHGDEPGGCRSERQ